ncbi:MAG: hypothetical protein HOP17_00570 [Acidobacteria bacterium]|nr:hypothetical protein [Acidobacteriota bacterium]
MITDKEIKEKGMQALIGALGRAQASRFITLTLQEPLNYTEWRKNIFDGQTMEDLIEEIGEFEKNRDNKELIS